MAAAARMVKLFLLLICFSAVARPISTAQRDTGGREHPGRGFRQLDSADGASSVQGPTFSIWQVLVHFGSIEHRCSRRARRKRRLRGSHQPALFLLLPHGMLSSQTPLELLTGKLTDFNKTKQRSFHSIFLGCGAYFLILLLLCADVEKNPGPENFEENFEEIYAALESDHEKIEMLWEQYKKLSLQVYDLNKKLEVHQQKLEILETDRRRKNAVIFGVPTEANLNKVLDSVLVEKLQLAKSGQKELIVHATRFGKEGPKRPILIEFKAEADKRQALRLAPRLKGTDIFLSEDLSPDQRIKRRKIVSARKLAAENGIASKVRRQGLLVGDQIVPLEELESESWFVKFLPKIAIQKDKGLPDASPRPEQLIQVATPSAPAKLKKGAVKKQGAVKSQRLRKIEHLEKTYGKLSKSCLFALGLLESSESD